MPTTITVKLDPSSRWSISLRVNDTRDLKLKPVQKQIGIDARNYQFSYYQ
ncbi:hypothetical protein [Okeania sp. KiyG1]